MARFSAEVLDIILAVVLFLIGLGYSVSGFPASIVVACVIWAIAWAFFSHLFFIFDGTDSCPIDVKITLWGGATFLIIITLWHPVRAQYAKEHAVQPPSPIPVQVAQPQPPVPNAPRSYLVFDGTPRYEKVDAKMQPAPNQDFEIGDQISFNFYYKVSGPNSVEFYQGDGRTYIESNATPAAQRKIIADFMSRIRTRKGLRPLNSVSTTLAPGQPPHFNSAFSTDDSGQSRILTRSDLDALQTGAEVVFVLIQIKYKDGDKVHHLRSCQLLQAPAFPSRGVWASCDQFTRSD